MKFYFFISELLKDYNELSQKYKSKEEAVNRLEQESVEKDEKIKDLQNKLESFLANNQVKDSSIDDGNPKLNNSQECNNDNSKQNPLKQESFRLPSRESLKQKNIDLNENAQEKISEKPPEKVILLNIKA